MNENDTEPEPDRDAASTRDGAREAGPTFEEGRYLYCAVAVDDDTTAGTDDAIDAFEETGIDDEPIRLLAIDGQDFGLLLHECDSLYDTDRMDLLRKWLLEHQRVIDVAGEHFGTPLPFQFDTIITGEDDRVREWAEQASETLSGYLASLAGHWEYRIELLAEEGDLESELEAEDPRLNELAAEIDEASSGTEFLLEKQYDQRLSELKRDRRRDRGAELEERLTAFAREVHHLGQQRAALLDDSEDDPVSPDSDGSEERSQARLAVLAHEDHEEAIGNALDTIAAEPGVTIRFTGPWPPYTFAPEIGADSTEDAGSGGGSGGVEKR
ncbi:gas vesicle protein GvpFL [Halobacteriales archaeon QS_3_64_16]|nr:MAG: gas vesicle protein GvpFL [Halobacteriales archaeon QS_3_64_16]